MKIALTAFFMTMIPYVAERLLHISFPFGVKAMIPFALFMHAAGGIMRWYWELSGIYYDKIAHMIGGIALGLVIFVCILTIILFSEWGITKRSVLFLTALITFCFGFFWEFEEMSIDSVMMTIFRVSAQHRGYNWKYAYPHLLFIAKEMILCRRTNDSHGCSERVSGQDRPDQNFPVVFPSHAVWRRHFLEILKILRAPVS
jgi:hypothetical protein